MTRYEMIDYLLEEGADYTKDELEAMDPYDLINAWLEWEGIRGYTGDIIENVFGICTNNGEGEVPDDVYVNM